MTDKFLKGPAWKKANLWAQNPLIARESQEEIKILLEKNDEHEIEERFYKDLEFGTGGMRSILGAGTNRINIYTIRRATQALCQEVLAEKTQNPSICISYDSRIMSYELAIAACEVIMENKIKAYLFSKLAPVALLSFAVRSYSSQAGIMITASHNPPEYNGFKVFWNDGAQVIPPYDQNIISHYNALTDFAAIAFTPFNQEHKYFAWISTDVIEKYQAAILNSSLNREFCREHGDKLKIVYTPIHGTGLDYCTQALKNLGMKNVLVVKEQAAPDGRFPTVKSPNPEDPKALKMAVDLMLQTQSDLVMGSDPDTDRLGVALQVNGEIFYPTGNQIGVLKLHYILDQLKIQNKLQQGLHYIVKTIVSTPLLDKISESFGVEVYNTLTGFKWICGKINEIEQKFPQKTFLFGTEESFGYLCHPHVRDKDGVSSVAQMAEVALYHKMRNLNLAEALDEIYTQYGYFREDLLSLDYLGIEGQEKISRIMAKFRNLSDKSLLDETIVETKDYLTGIDGLPKSNVLGLMLKSGGQIYLRPSGTEPKIKFYLMSCEKSSHLAESKAKAKQKAQKLIGHLKEICEKT